MAVSVVSDFMPGGQHGASNFRPLAHVTSDQKERGLGIVFGQNVEQMHRMRIIGAIVKGQRHLAGIAAMRDRGAIKLRRRGHGGVSSITGSGSGSHRDVKPEHEKEIW